MSKARMHHCHHCGAELGIYVAYHGDIQSCGAQECENEARDIERQRDEEAREAAERDNYEAYR